MVRCADYLPSPKYQNKMIRGEEKIKISLLKSGKRVREATSAMQMQLHAALTGEANGEEDETQPPAGQVIHADMDIWHLRSMVCGLTFCSQHRSDLSPC